MNATLSNIQLTEVLQPLVKDNFIIYCGAGISIPPPSCAPSWWTITEEILESFFARIPDNWGLPKDLIIKDPDKQPEVIFENFANMLDLRLYEIFKILDLSEPNDNHRFIAKLAKAGILKACITTNFDIFIERALKEEKVDYELLVENREYNKFVMGLTDKQGVPKLDGNKKFILCKIHGTISKPDTIVSVASAYKSSKGFSIPKADLISLLLKTYPVLFLGYSGWDFEHINYRRFWDRAGPQCKGIYWNRRPGEIAGPKFDEIFKESRQVFQFCSGELPVDFVTGIQRFQPKMVTTKQEIGYTKEFSDQQFNVFKTKRLGFLREWAMDIPESLACGLVISEANQFSQQYKETVKELHEQSEETDSTSFGSTNVISELAQKLGRKEITMEQYQVETQKFMLQMRMSLIKKSFRPQVLEMLQKNRFPGLTDDQMKRDIFLGFLGAFTRNFNLEEAVQNTLSIMDRYMKCVGKPDPESQVEMQIVGTLPSIMKPKKSLWEPYYQKMLVEKERFLKKEISREDLNKAVQDLTQQSVNATLGISISVTKLFDVLVNVIAKSTTEHDLEIGCEAVFLCVDAAAGWIYSDILAEKDTGALFGQIARSAMEKHSVEESLIEAFDTRIRRIFQPIALRLKEYGELSIARTLLEGSILKVWNTVIPNIDSNEIQKYSKAWDAGTYPLRFTNPSIYSFIRKKIDPWLNYALKKFPPRFLHKFLGVLATVAEGGNAFEWLREITQKSLDLTEGLVTEATATNIPSSLAGMYELRGDLDNALKYYLLALDAIKTTLPPNWQDAVVYRAALLIAKSSTQEAQKKALKIIAQYHPAFHGNGGIIKMPARQHCKDLAETIANNLGYAGADLAIKTLFP